MSNLPSKGEIFRKIACFEAQNGPIVEQLEVMLATGALPKNAEGEGGEGEEEGGSRDLVSPPSTSESALSLSAEGSESVADLVDRARRSSRCCPSEGRDSVKPGMLRCVDWTVAAQNACISESSTKCRRALRRRSSHMQLKHR